MSQGRLAILLLVLVLCRTAAFAQDADPQLRSDAQLADVQFVGAGKGWAVGDRGTIWHTEDSGQNWQLQATNVDCRLNAVCFLDEQIGWAAGGYTHPYTHITTGIVLRTRDGGRRWTCDRNSLLPAVRSIQFFDPAHGVAVGSASAMFPAGVFTTDDGGRSWSSLPPPGKDQTWLAAAFSDPVTGVLVGRSGASAMVRRKAIEPTPSAFGLRALHRVKSDGRGNHWLVGDGGLIMQSDDGGATWLTPQRELPRELRQQFDFQALEVHGENLWLAGSPGTRVIHSADGGNSWQVQSTGQHLPLHAIEFVDPLNGWAVGDLGTILNTTDGGQSWHVQRRGGERAALVGIFSEPRDVPLELFAKLSADDGYLGVVELLHRTDLETPTPHALDAPDRIHEALVRGGASAAHTAWQFPTRQAGLNLSSEKLIETWNRASDGDALKRLDEHLVRQLRIWRPSIVVGSLAADRDAARLQLTHQLTLRAIDRAADPAVYPDQLQHAGLSVWKAVKLFGSLPAGELGTANVTTAQTTRTGRTVADLASPARGLVDRSYAPSPAEVGFRLIVDQLPQEVGRKDFFSGIALSPGGEARRKLREIPDQTVDAIRRSAQARRNLNAILAQAEQRRADDGRYLAEVTGLTRTMDPYHAAEVLLQLADRYHRNGQWQLAADTYDAIVERYPQHPAAGAALVWLVQYYSSSEAAWRVSQRQQLVNVQREHEKTDGGEELKPAPRSVQRATALLSLDGEETDRPSRAAGYAKQLEQHSAILAAEPTVRFPLAAAQRNRGYPREAERFFLGFVRNRSEDAWRDGAQAEVAMLESRAPEPNSRQSAGAPQLAKPLYRCVRTAARPQLDGKLNDAVWRAARPIELKSPLRDDADWPATAMLACDDAFLYLAVTCRESSESRFAPSTGPRPRDGDLTAHDRVEFYFDLDRDYVTAYRLAIDARGWTNESCWHDASWNPKWFVACARSEAPQATATWIAEAAIPLAELSQRVHPGQRWALGVQRIVPNTGLQSWTQPAAVKAQPEGFGLLQFD